MRPLIWYWYDLRIACNRWRIWRESFLRWLAFRLPKSLCYWVFIRMISREDMHGWTAIDVLKAYDDWYIR